MAACSTNFPLPHRSIPAIDDPDAPLTTIFETSALLQTEQLGAAQNFGDCDNASDKRPWRRLSSFKVYCPQTKTMRRIQDVNEGAKLLFSGLVEPYESKPGLEKRRCWVRDIGPIVERSFQGYGESELIVWISTDRGHYALQEPSDGYRAFYESLRVEADLAAAAHNLLSEIPDLSASALGSRLPNRLRPHFEKLQTKIAAELLALEFIDLEDGTQLKVADLAAVRTMNGAGNPRNRPWEGKSSLNDRTSDVTERASASADVTVQQLVDMGYPKKRAQQAAKAARGGGIVEALDWLEAKKVEAEVDEAAPTRANTAPSVQKKPSEHPPEKPDVASSNVPSSQSADEEEESSPPLRVNRTKRRMSHFQGAPLSDSFPPANDAVPAEKPPAGFEQGLGSGFRETVGGLAGRARALFAGLGEKSTGVPDNPLSRALHGKRTFDERSESNVGFGLAHGLRRGGSDLGFEREADQEAKRRGLERCSKRGSYQSSEESLGRTVQEFGERNRRNRVSKGSAGDKPSENDGRFCGGGTPETRTTYRPLSSWSVKQGSEGNGNTANCFERNAAKGPDRMSGGTKSGAFSPLAESPAKGGVVSALKEGGANFLVPNWLRKAGFRNLGGAVASDGRGANRTAGGSLLTTAKAADEGHMEAADLHSMGTADVPFRNTVLSGSKATDSRENDARVCHDSEEVERQEVKGNGNGTEDIRPEGKGRTQLISDGLAERRTKAGRVRNQALVVRSERPNLGGVSDVCKPSGLWDELRRTEPEPSGNGPEPELNGNGTDTMNGSGRNRMDRSGTGRNSNEWNGNETQRAERSGSGMKQQETGRNGGNWNGTEPERLPAASEKPLPETGLDEEGPQMPVVCDINDPTSSLNPSGSFEPPSRLTPPVDLEPAKAPGFENPSLDLGPSKLSNVVNPSLQALTPPRLGKPEIRSNLPAPPDTDVRNPRDPSGANTADTGNAWPRVEPSKPHDCQGKGPETNSPNGVQVNRNADEGIGVLFEGDESGAIARGGMRGQASDCPQTDGPQKGRPQTEPPDGRDPDADFRGGELEPFAGPLFEAERLQEEENHPGAILSLLGGEVEILIDAFGIWWESDGCYYTAKALRYDPESHKHLVRFFVDQEKLWLALWREKVVPLVEGVHYSGPKDIPLFLDRNGNRPPEPERRNRNAGPPPVHKKKSRAKGSTIGGRLLQTRALPSPEPEEDDVPLEDDADVSDDVAADVSTLADVEWASAVRNGPTTFHFLFENVASANRGLDGVGPDGELVEREHVWAFMTRHLWGITPEPLNSVRFSVASRNRKYVSNIPRTGRANLLPTPPLHISQMWPNYYTNFPEWDCRKGKDKLNMINTKELHPAGLRALNGTLGQGGELDGKRRALIRSYNLIFTSPSSVANIREEEVEIIMGFPEGHTRCGIPRSKIFEALGNSFQVDTIAYLLSPLVPRFRSIPGGISVLALFDGIGGLGVTLWRLKIPIKRYISVEIEEHCRTVVKHWWFRNGLNETGNLEFVEDIKLLTTAKIAEIVAEGPVDLVGGGSPCNNLTGNNRQPAGSAGGRSGLQGKDSRLFLEYPRVLNVVERFQLRLGRGDVVAV